MAFASLFVPLFPVQAVVRTEPPLRAQPVALIDGRPPLCKVVAVNELAGQAGVECGMTKASAAQFAGVVLRQRSPALESSAHAALLDICWSVSPRIEDTAEDTVILDLQGLGHLFPSEAAIGERLLQSAANCGLFPNVAIASNIETAILVSRGFAGLTVIASGEEAQRLSGLPVDVLRPSPEVAETLGRWGVHTCGGLGALPVLQLSERLGQAGVHLHEQARGAGTRSLVVAVEEGDFREEMELDDAVEDLDSISFLLGRMLDDLCARLMARALSMTALSVQFELQPSFETALDARKEIVRSKPRPANFETLLDLPLPMRDSRLLLKLLRLRLQSNSPGAPVQKIVLLAKPARSRNVQAGLFVPRFPEPEKLELTIARLANIVGAENVGSPVLTNTHHPESFQMRRTLTPPSAKELQQTPLPSPELPSAIPFGFRVFRPPIPARVELHAGRPVRAFFQNMQAQVLAASGPWPTSGNWWREDPWNQEEWDMEMDVRPFSKNYEPTGSSAFPPHRGLYRLYYDALQQNWFLRGSYD